MSHLIELPMPAQSPWQWLLGTSKTAAVCLYRDKLVLVAVSFVIVLSMSAAFAEIVAPYNPIKQSLSLRNSAPTLRGEKGAFPHLLGTDQLGRDELSRLIHAGRVSLTIGIAAVAVSGSFGVVLGLVAGFYRGAVDDIIMRFVDVVMGFPTLLLALAVLYAAGAGFLNLVVVLAATRWMLYARVARGMTFSLRETAFVEAARASGASDKRIIFRHILPNLLSPIIVLGTLEIARAVLAEAALSFLGLGIRPPDSSWGLMLSQGREYMTTAWWLVTIPGVAIFMTTLSFNLIASWARAVTDPVQRWRWLGTRH